MKYKVKTGDAGSRLDLFLVKKTKKTRGQIQQQIESGAVLVDGKKMSNHYALKVGEELEIKSAKDFLKKSKEFLVEPEIVFENKEFIIVNKPSGLIVHGAPHIKQPTLADWLVKKFPELKKVGEDKARPGIMHRLDKDVSGLLVIARTNDSFANLKKQFKNREIEKEYTALVYEPVSKDNDKIIFSLKRSAGGHRQAAVPEGYNFKDNFLELREAYTEFRVLKRTINYTLMAVKIMSGRKHQIRVHLFAYGHPLVGDNLYSTKKTREQNRKHNLGRIFLVSSKLSFKDLAGKKQSFSVELPQQLKDFLQTIT
jgi:23S rRNA pseudouridine1911/1915/1917 synthase